MSVKNIFSIRNYEHYYFNTPNEFSDVKISFKNEKGKIIKIKRFTVIYRVYMYIDVILYANKVILSEASPIIKAFLAIEPDGIFMIDEDDEHLIITSMDVIDLLNFIYPQFTMKLTEQNSTFSFSVEFFYNIIHYYLSYGSYSFIRKIFN